MDITAKDVANTILSAPKVSHTDDFLPLPSVPAGYEAVIKSSTDPQAVALDGRVNNASQEAKTVGLVFEVIRLSDGSKATTREIPVVIPSSTHWLTLPAAYAVGIGKTVKLIPDVAPYAAAELVYSSSDPEIAAVNGQGVVTGAAKGITMITVSTKDGKLRTATMIYAGEETVAYNEDFEGYENGEKLEWEQNIEEDRSTLTVIEKNRNRFLKLYQPVIGGSTSCYHMQSFAPQSGIVTTSFDMMAENKNYAYFLLCDSNGKIIVQVDFLSDYIYVDNGGKVEKISDEPYQAGQWYHITVTSNTDTAQYTISVEGQESYTFSFREAAVDVGMIKLGMFRDNENTVYYDNIHVTANQKSEIAVSEVARAVTSVPPVRNTDTTLPLPAVPDGFQIVIKSSDSGSVASDGTLYLGEERQTAGVIFTVIKTSDQSEAQTKKITVSIPVLKDASAGSRPDCAYDLNAETGIVSGIGAGTTVAQLTVGFGGERWVRVLKEGSELLEGLAATGMTVQYKDGGQETYTVAVTGDLDGDGGVTISDVMEACKILARQSAGTRPSALELAAGSLDAGQGITISDVMEMCKILARKV